MKYFNFVILMTVAVAMSNILIVASGKSEFGCKKYSMLMASVKKDVAQTESRNDALEKVGMVAPRSVFGVRSYDQCVDAIVKNANVHTVGAQFFKNKFNMTVDDYESIGVKCNDFWRISAECRKDVGHQTQDKYRSIDGLNNNLKHPYWGASNTPYARFGSRNYEDGVYSIKKNLPNARLLVTDVLDKAVRSPPNPMTYNVLGLTIILFATHDLHYQVPMQPKSSENDILCCSKDRLAVLPSNLLNTACFPIEISKDDPFYKDGKVGCLNMLRAQIGEYPNDVQAGEIINQATAYLDLSLIYGNDESELNQIRLFESGQFRMGKNNLLPVDSNGKYLPSMSRFVAVPIGSIWPSLFARNHNHLAERLAILNPHWKDEVIFQEARRINIASFQYNLITAKSIERVFSKPVNEKYSALRNAATFIEFTYTYRGAHYYIPSHMLFLDENYKQTKQLLQSDTMGQIELLEDNFDDALRGVMYQLVNTGPYSDEIINRIGKNTKNGYGIDLIAIDIQRSRDHGIPSFVQIRRQCNLKPEINSFDDFNLIFNKTNVDLLKKVYASYEDVDFYVGGLLEAFERVGNPFAGSTFGCIIGENYNNAMGGDIYFYSHPENPYPMTKTQLDAISNFSVSNLFCVNSGLKETNKLWSFAPNAINPQIDCKNFPQMDLSAWKE